LSIQPINGTFKKAQKIGTAHQFSKVLCTKILKMFDSCDELLMDMKEKDINDMCSSALELALNRHQATRKKKNRKAKMAKIAKILAEKGIKPLCCSIQDCKHDSSNDDIRGMKCCDHNFCSHHSSPLDKLFIRDKSKANLVSICPICDHHEVKEVEIMGHATTPFDQNE